MSAYEQPGFKVGQLLANTTMSSNQYYGVVLSTTSRGRIKLATGGEDTPIFGVLQNKPGSGESAEVTTFGVTKVVTDGSVKQGSIITFTTAGKATVATSTEYRQGWCMDGPTSTGAANRVLTMYLNPLGPSSGLST